VYDRKPDIINIKRVYKSNVHNPNSIANALHLRRWFLLDCFSDCFVVEGGFKKSSSSSLASDGHEIATSRNLTHFPFPLVSSFSIVDFFAAAFLVDLLLGFAFGDSHWVSDGLTSAGSSFSSTALSRFLRNRTKSSIPGSAAAVGEERVVKSNGFEDV